MAKQKQQQVIPGDFSDEEKAQLQHYGQAMVNPPSDFDEEVEKELAKHYPNERSAQKMKGAMRGGDLGPEQFEQEQAQQGQAMQNLQALQGAQQAQQAQAAQTGVNAPPAPTGTSGVTTPYPAQAKPGAVPTTGKMPSQPPEAPGGQEEATQEPE